MIEKAEEEEGIRLNKKVGSDLMRESL